MFAVLRNRKHRDIGLQVLFIGVIVAILASAVIITRRNLDAQGIAVGWDFLNYATGWTISFSLIPYDINSSYARALVVGFLNTLLLAALTLFLATILGGAIGTARLSAHRLLSKIALVYVQFFRNIPLILQAFFWYSVFTHLPNARNAYHLGELAYFSNRGFYLPGLNIERGAIGLAVLTALALLIIGYVARRFSLLRRNDGFVKLAGFVIVVAAVAGVLSSGRIAETPLFDLPVQRGLRIAGGLELAPEFCAAVIAISLFGASYIAEIVRAGLLAVSRGKVEAGLALGLTGAQIFWKIRLPLAIRIMLPTLTNQYVWLVKATSIGIAIGFSDFFMIVANSINHSGQTLSLIFILIAGFWAINFSLAAVLNAVNRAIALRGQNVR
ncbi:ABC transporter permease subunit [Shinella sp. HZN7]|uniref:ABC transporter permease subunit n=1 Tax=Shinella sp. (strain HZN7) TaxID=879274 RepID=UPI0007DA8D39|nr:ABC transporter permease subunit [Shinella sp. HZN7]ANH07487.1 hypothetical protein shn_25340 [Shinella sp. HZN7]